MDDEYTMSWSDAAATQAAFWALECDAKALGHPRQHGIVGKVRWWQRCLAPAPMQDAALDSMQDAALDRLRLQTGRAERKR